VFGRRKREEAAAAEAAREVERGALFARLAERPEHICPFLGLEADRTGYVEGISDEHRCFAFGDPAPISAEQQTRVCQERGYGNCPRYLRGVLVIPTEELEALRRPRPATEAPPPPPPTARDRRRRGPPVVVLVFLLALLIGGGIGAYFLLLREPGVAVDPTSSPTPSAAPSDEASPSAPPTSVAPSILPSPTPEPTPDAGDAFAFYEVSVDPLEYDLYSLDDGGAVSRHRAISFAAYSFARVEPVEAADGQIYWMTLNGELTGFGYRFPGSGDFRIRAIFLDEAGGRRSFFLNPEELTTLPEATPAPVR